MQRRLSISFVAVCVLFALLTIRLMFIEKTSGERYEKKVLSQQEYDSSIIPYQRGDITDRRGTVLATSVDVYNVILDSKVLNAVKNTNEKNKKQSNFNHFYNPYGNFSLCPYSFTYGLFFYNFKNNRHLEWF